MTAETVSRIAAVVLRLVLASACALKLDDIAALLSSVQCCTEVVFQLYVICHTHVATAVAAVAMPSHQNSTHGLIKHFSTNTGSDALPDNRWCLRVLTSLSSGQSYQGASYWWLSRPNNQCHIPEHD